MKQLAQNLRTGETVLLEVPTPQIRKGHVLIKTHKSLVSTGTEKMLIGFGKASLLEKARQQPEKIKLILEKVKADGVVPAVRSVLHRLDQLLPLGYCNAGDVVEVGEGVYHFKKGDRVISNGPHAEMVCVPVNLIAKIPDNVTFDEASFTVVASVGLQAIRLLSPALGETVVVIGLGLIGMLTAQMLQNNGCQVIGFEIDERKRKIADERGIITFDPGSSDAEHIIQNYTHGIGSDGVIIAASAKSDNLVKLAARIARKRGKIVLIGSVGLHLNREDFYKKELTFQVSCSYGPGRYDPEYEEKGIDYPVSFVRWTENRNFEAVLKMLATGSLDVEPLISGTFPITDFARVYEHISDSRSIACIFNYPETVNVNRTIRYRDVHLNGSDVVAGIVGAGNYTRVTMLPLLKAFKIKSIASKNGFSAAELAHKYDIPCSTSDFNHILQDESINLVMITTRHDQHAAMVIHALNAGKHVFVEKPLALFPEELENITTAWQNAAKHQCSLTVGFNRRFSPFVLKMKTLLGAALMNVVVTVNAGQVPGEVWIHDPIIGGGRILGEGCHFIDLVSFLTDSFVVAVCMNAMDDHSDNASILLRYQNGSSGVINYFSNGHKGYSKERVEVYSLGRTLVLDNYISLKGFGFKDFTSQKSGQDKGHKEQFRRLADVLENGGKALTPFSELVNTSKATFAALESARSACWVSVE